MPQYPAKFCLYVVKCKGIYLLANKSMTVVKDWKCK